MSTTERSSRRARLLQAVGLRVAVWYAAVFVISAGTVAAVGYQILAASLVSRDHELLRIKLEEYANRYESAGLTALSDAVAAEQAAGGPDTVVVRLVAPGANVLLVSPSPVWRTFGVSPFDPLRTPPRDALETLPAPDRDMRLEVVSRQLFDGTLIQVGRTTVGRDTLLSAVRETGTVLMLLILAVGLAGGVALTRQALRPLRELVTTARDIARTGQLDARVAVAADDDVVGELGRVFNLMLERIQTLVDGMRGALDNVAHDLRTPIARLRARAEAALAADCGRDEALSALADCVEEADQLMAFLSTLLDISEAETGTMRLALEPVVLQDAVTDTIDLYEDTADERGVTIEVDVPADAIVHADRQRLRQVLANLIDNALKYTPRGGTVAIRSVSTPDDITIAVTDTGAGIATSDLPRVWERLYRADESRGEPGLGLGLSLVHAIVTAHGGSVDVTSAQGRGSTFRVHFPAGRMTAGAAATSER